MRAILTNPEASASTLRVSGLPGEPRNLAPGESMDIEFEGGTGLSLVEAKGEQVQVATAESEADERNPNVVQAAAE